MGFGSEVPEQRAASRWQGLPVVAASAVAPLIVLHWGTHLCGEEGPEASALSVGTWVVWAVLALPPLAATAAGLLVFRPPRARSVFVACLGGLVVYALGTALLFIVVMHGFSAASRFGGPLAVVIVGLSAIPWVATLLASLAAGGVVGFTTVEGIYHLLSSPRPSADGRVARPVERRGARHPGSRSRLEQGFRWLGALAGAAGIVLPICFSKAPDTLSALPLFFLFPGAWLSAVCVVLILRPRAPAPGHQRAEPGARRPL